MSEKLNRANRILDRACKEVGLDPVQVRVAMVNSIRDKQREAGLTLKLPPASEVPGASVTGWNRDGKRLTT